MDRATANRKLLELLADYLAKNPDIRFGQALRNLGIVDEVRDAAGMPAFWRNGFSEEPTRTLARVRGALARLGQPVD